MSRAITAALLLRLPFHRTTAEFSCQTASHAPPEERSFGTDLPASDEATCSNNEAGYAGKVI